MASRIGILGVIDFVRVANSIAGGTTDHNCVGIDMANGGNAAKRVTFVFMHGLLLSGTVCGLKAQGSDDDGATDAYSDLAGTAVPILDSDDNDFSILEVDRPDKRWVRCVVTRSVANSGINGVLALLSDLDEVYVADDARLSNSKRVHAPLEGTP